MRTETHTDVLQATVTMTLAGRPKSSRAEVRSHAITERKVLLAHRGQPTRYQLHHLVDVDRAYKWKAGRFALEQTIKGALHGQVEHIDYRDGAWRRRLVPGPATARQRAELARAWTDEDGTYPKRPQRIGARWQVTGERLRRVLHLEQAVTTVGKMQLHFAAVVPCGGLRCAQIVASGDVQATVLDDEGAPTKITWRFAGRWLRSLEYHVDDRVELTGPVSMASTQRSERGRVTMAVSGTVRLRSTAVRH